MPGQKSKRAAAPRYSATVHVEIRYDSSDRLFIAEAAEFGCWASGTTEESALHQLYDVMRDYLVTFENAAPDSIQIDNGQEAEAPPVPVSHRELIVAAG